MTDTKETQALEALMHFDRMIDFIENVVTRHAGSWCKNDFASKGEFEKIRTALQSQVEKDRVIDLMVEALKELKSTKHSPMCFQENGWSIADQALAEHAKIVGDE